MARGSSPGFANPETKRLKYSCDRGSRLRLLGKLVAQRKARIRRRGITAPGLQSAVLSDCNHLEGTHIVKGCALQATAKNGCHAPCEHSHTCLRIFVDPDNGRVVEYGCHFGHIRIPVLVPSVLRERPRPLEL
eukprot:4922901-Prymnesium_polylepis.1